VALNKPWIASIAPVRTLAGFFIRGCMIGADMFVLLLEC
jgi:hypothetical protein